MMLKKCLQKSTKFLICLMSLLLFATLMYSGTYVYADEDVVTDIRFGANDWANNFKSYHPIYHSGDYKISSGSYDKITKIESHNANDDFWLSYNYDLNKYRLAILKGDIKIDVYSNSDSWYDHDYTSADDYERPDFEIQYGYTSDRNNLEKKLEEDSGNGNSGKEFRWSQTLPSNVRYVMINFDTEMGGSWTSDGFGANYTNMHLYFQDNVAPKVKDIYTGVISSSGIGQRVYIDLYFDEAVTVDSNSKLRLNAMEKNGNYVYADFAYEFERSNDYKVQYQYTVQEGDYIPSCDYLYANLSSYPPSGIKDLAGNTYNGNYDVQQHYNTSLMIDGRYPIINIVTPPVNGYQTTYNTVVRVSEDVSASGLPGQFKYLWSTSSSISKYDPKWSDSNSYKWFNNGDTISTPVGMEGNYYLHIGAWDNAGNTIVKSTGEIKLDATPPTVAFSTNGSETLAPTHEVTVDASDEENGSGIDPDANFKYIWSTETTIPVDSLLWDSANTFKDELKVEPPSGLVGDYYLHVKVWDGANKVVSRTTDTFTIDSKAPEVVFTPNGHGDVRADYLVDIGVSDDNTINTKKYQWKKVGDPVDPNNFIVWSGEELSTTIQASETGVVEAGDYVLVLEVIDELGNGTGEYVESPIFKIDPDVETITVNSIPENDGTYNKSYDITIDTIGYEDTIHYQWTDSNIAPPADDENWIEVTEQISYGQDLNGEKYLHMKAISDGIDYVSSKKFLLDNTNPTIESFAPNEMLIPVKGVSSNITVSDNILGRDIDLYAKWVLKSSLGENSELWDSEMIWDDAEKLTGNTTAKIGVNGEYMLFIKAIDEADNQDISHSEIFKIDNTVPIGAIEITTDTSTNGYATISLDNVIDNLSPNEKLKYIYSIDGGLNFSKTWIPVSVGLEVRLPSNKPSQHLDIHMIFMDEAGNISNEISTVKDIIYSPQEVVTYIEYSTTDFTSSDVTAYLRTNGAGNISIMNNDGSDEFVFTENGTFYFSTIDYKGTVKQTKAIVYNIDKEVLEPKIDYSTKELTNEDVIVTFTPQEETVIALVPPEDPLVVNQTGINTYTFSENGVFTFNLEDSLGNKKDINIVIDNIDKTPPVLTTMISNIDPTSQPVEVTLSSNEEIVVLNNLGSIKRIFRENGSYTFKVVDLAGNETIKIVNVTNIDTTPPEVMVNYSTEAWTKNNVTATITSGEPMIVLNNGGSTQYEFNSNGLFYFKVSDTLGNVASVPVRVSNIDKDKPIIDFEGNDRLVFVENGDYAFDDVIVTDNITQNLESEISINTGTFNISQVGDYQINYSVSDEAGNLTSVTRDAIVISPDDYRVFVSGDDVATGGKVMLYEGNINLGIFNECGDVKIRWKKGRVVRGLMKAGYNIQTDSDFSVNERGWYTIYVQDQERNTEYFYVYIASIE